jgi:hypothetical protein
MSSVEVAVHLEAWLRVVLGLLIAIVVIVGFVSLAWYVLLCWSFGIIGS